MPEDGGAGKTLVAAFLRVPFLPLSLCEASMPWRKGPATRGHPQGPSLCSWRFALPLLGAELAGLWKSVAVTRRAPVLALRSCVTQQGLLSLFLLLCLLWQRRGCQLYGGEAVLSYKARK